VPTQKVGEAVQRFRRRAEQRKIGGKDVHHPLPHVQFGADASGFRRRGIAAGVVEQHFVLADVQKDGRQIGKIAMERRDARITWIVLAEIQVRGGGERRAREERIGGGFGVSCCPL
jgi:hypothetical protein